jgi:hypothetical protein
MIVACGLVAHGRCVSCRARSLGGTGLRGHISCGLAAERVCMSGVVSGEKKGSEENAPFFSMQELSRRWACSRSSVARILKRARIPRVVLGMGKNGMVRYPREEVIIYEATVRAD